MVVENFYTIIIQQYSSIKYYQNKRKNVSHLSQHINTLKSFTPLSQVRRRIWRQQTCLTMQHPICACRKSGVCHIVVDICCCISYLLFVNCFVHNSGSYFLIWLDLLFYFWAFYSLLGCMSFSHWWRCIVTYLFSSKWFGIWWNAWLLVFNTTSFYFYNSRTVEVTPSNSNLICVWFSKDLIDVITVKYLLIHFVQVRNTI